MALRPWIENPPSTFTGVTTFTPPAYPNTPDPMKLSAPTPGRYSDSHPIVSGPLPLAPSRSTPGVPKSKAPAGKRVGTSPAFLDHDDMVKRQIVP